MVNYRLKSLILEVVDNQLRDNDPPVTREVYEKLQEAGYSSQEAKEKIGAIVIEEIYDVSKGLREFDERKYTKALKKMLRKSISEELREDYEEWRDDEVEPIATKLCFLGYIHGLCILDMIKYER